MNIKLLTDLLVCSDKKIFARELESSEEDKSEFKFWIACDNCTVDITEQICDCLEMTFDIDNYTLLWYWTRKRSPGFIPEVWIIHNLSEKLYGNRTAITVSRETD